ncbi:ATP-dependent DNA helicase UvrD2 [Corynebacterium glyciniphilum]|uniref:ATP-dependent DNA helicase UvrD2 n=1 Tax=Corynebacterium glyciniphilum TaxID=1404244 RepID=UPI00264BFA3B|nr:ATP-dependent DNA helicase UvrD2 [Corynebacterium glyciniphilum]MDN6706537.1 ATP-dependent DNA helicase UvrD2 [Corynebacterium glyciniphilum]
MSGRLDQLNLDALDPEQLRAATAPRGPVSIIAGAGTGKTRTITHRIAHLVSGGFVNPDHVLAVTFTNRAAAELRERLTMMGVARVQAKTFHAAAMHQLRYFWPKVMGDTPWELLDSKFPLVARITRAVGLEPDRTLLADLLGEIEWSKASLIAPTSYPSHIGPDRRDCPVEPEKFVKIFEGYEQAKATPDRVLLDFDDLLQSMAGLLESEVGVADEFRERYRTFVVDEYQDVTPLQQRLLDAWLGDRDDLTVVGDANQTIYSFNGATPDHLLRFSTRFPDSTTVRLHRDYRSTPQVVALANRVIGQARGRAAGTRLVLEGQRPPGPDPEFSEYPDETVEADDVARRIAELIKQGVPAAEIAVLYRINAQSAAFEYALDKAGIAYQVKGGDGFFQRAEIRQAVQALGQAARQVQARARVQDQDDAQDQLAGSLVDQVRAVLLPVGLTPSEPEGAQERQRWQSLSALADLAGELTATTPGLDLPGLMGLLKERAQAKNPPRMQGVTLASVHAAKGLEWDAVFLVGLVDGTLPIRHALKGSHSEDAVEEERRLLYVGVTRAREHLHLSWSQARQPGGKATRRRTRFLDGMVPWEAERVAAQKAPKSKPRDSCDTCGARLTTPEQRILGLCDAHAGDIDQVLVTELRGWRSAAAKSRDVPAYVVMSDATLRAVCHRAPTTVQELVQVPGIGPMKVEQFGEDILGIIRNFR